MYILEWKYLSFDFIRDHSAYAPSQLETALHCNVVSHWLGVWIHWMIPVTWDWNWFRRVHKTISDVLTSVKPLSGPMVTQEYDAVWCHKIAINNLRSYAEKHMQARHISSAQLISITRPLFLAFTNELHEKQWLCWTIFTDILCKISFESLRLCHKFHCCNICLKLLTLWC